MGTDDLALATRLARRGKLPHGEKRFGQFGLLRGKEQLPFWEAGRVGQGAQLAGWLAGWLEEEEEEREEQAGRQADRQTGSFSQLLLWPSSSSTAATAVVVCVPLVVVLLSLWPAFSNVKRQAGQDQSQLPASKQNSQSPIANRPSRHTNAVSAPLVSRTQV